MMNYIEDLNDEQLLALTDEDIEVFIRLECARNGAPLLPKQAPEAPAKPEVKPDIEVWEVRGISGSYFSNKEDADRVATLVNSLPRLEPNYLTGHYAGPRGLQPTEDTVKLVSERFWSAPHYAAHRAVLEVFTRQDAEYKTAKTEYDNAHKLYKSHSESVWSRVKGARERRAYDENIRSTFAEYTALANGDEQVAFQFMLKRDWKVEDLNRVLGPIKGGADGNAEEGNRADEAQR